MAKILKYPATGKVVLEKEEGLIDWETGKTYYYCHYHDVATGKYECPYADLKDNSIVCTAECIFNALGKEKLSTTYDETYVETHSSFSEEVDDEWRAF